MASTHNQTGHDGEASRFELYPGSSIFISVSGLEGKVHGNRIESIDGPAGSEFSKTARPDGGSHSPWKVLHSLVRNFLSKGRDFGQRLMRSTRETSAPESQDASRETHGPRTEDVASHLLTDYGIMGVSKDEDSAKWAAEQMKSATAGSGEVSGSPNNGTFTILEEAPMSNATAARNESSTSQAGNSGSGNQGNASNIAKTAKPQQGLSKPQTNETVETANQTKAVGEQTRNQTGGAASGEGSIRLTVASLEPNQTIYLVLPKNTQIESGSNKSASFFSGEQKENDTQESSGLQDTIQPVKDSGSNASAVAARNASYGTIADIVSRNKNITMVTTEEELGMNNAESQSRSFQGAPGNTLGNAGIEKAKNEVYDDESLAKALSDSSLSSIVFSNKGLSSENYALGDVAQKKSSLEENDRKRRKYSRKGHGVREYFKAKGIHKRHRHKISLESRRHVLGKKDEVARPIERLSNASMARSQPTLRNDDGQSPKISQPQEKGIQSNFTAQVELKSSPYNFTAGNTGTLTQNVGNYSASASAVRVTSAGMPRLVEPTQDEFSKQKEQLVDSDAHRDEHERVTTSVLIQDDAGRTVYQGPVDILKANNTNATLGRISSGSGGQNHLLSLNDDQSRPEPVAPKLEDTRAGEITGKEAKFAGIKGNPLRGIPSDADYYSIAGKKGQDLSKVAHDVSPQPVESKPRQDSGSSVTQTQGQLQLSGGFIEKSKENGDYKADENLPHPRLQQQQSGAQSSMQLDSKSPDGGVHPLSEGERFRPNEEVFHVVLHDDHKITTDPQGHVTLTISGPLPRGEETVGPDGGSEVGQFAGNAGYFWSKGNAGQGSNAESGTDDLPKAERGGGQNGNPGGQKAGATTGQDRQGMFSQTGLGGTGPAETWGVKEKTTQNSMHGQGTEQKIRDGNHGRANLTENTLNGQANSTENALLDQANQKEGLSANQSHGHTFQETFSGSNSFPGNQMFMDEMPARPGNDNGQMGPGEPNPAWVDKAGDTSSSSNMVVKETDRASASLSLTNGLASNDDVAAMEGPTTTGMDSSANQGSQKLDCHVASSRPGTSALTLLTCRKKKFDPSTPRFGSAFGEQQTFPRKSQEHVPRLDEVLGALNQDTKASLNKEMMVEGRGIEKMLEGFTNPKVSMNDDETDYGSFDDSGGFQWIPDNHEGNSDAGYATIPWEMNVRSRAVWDPDHRISLPNSLVRDYWRRLHHFHHQGFGPRVPWERGSGSRREPWRFHAPMSAGQYGFQPAWIPERMWTNTRAPLRGKQRKASHQENATKRTSIFNKILKGDRDNCRPNAGVVGHSRMGEFEYLGRVLCSCPFGVGEW